MNSIDILLEQAKVYSKDIFNLSILSFYDLVEKGCLGEPRCNEAYDCGRSLYTVYTFEDGCKVVLDKGILFHLSDDVQTFLDMPKLTVSA